MCPRQESPPRRGGSRKGLFRTRLSSRDAPFAVGLLAWGPPRATLAIPARPSGCASGEFHGGDRPGIHRPPRPAEVTGGGRGAIGYAAVVSHRKGGPG